MPTPRPHVPAPVTDWPALAANIARWGETLGFQEIGIAGTDLAIEERRLADWLAAGRHGAMDYMARHGAARARPHELVPGTLRVITARMNYRPPGVRASAAVLDDPTKAFIARYALGRDYHKVLRGKLQSLADRIGEAAGAFGHRVFCDSAPVLEVAFGAKAGLGWRGKHTLLLSRDAGSTFFLGEIYTDLPLPLTTPVTEHCGTCRACLDACPTGAIVGPYELDARRCISYLTIEHHGSIPEALRPAIGNRIFGCDDCQLVCPWNKYARVSTLADFDARAPLDGATLLQLWTWDEAEFLRRTEGSAIRRIGHWRWQRNLAVALGNALRVAPDTAIEQALRARLGSAGELLAEHIAWALRQGARVSAATPTPPATAAG
jgi:epoxyqueuosine reductase